MRFNYRHTHFKILYEGNKVLGRNVLAQNIHHVNRVHLV